MAGGMVAQCDRVIVSLMEEIAALKEEYKDNQRDIASLSRTSVENSLGPYQEDHQGDVTMVTKNVNTQLAHGEMEIKFFRDITGIEILHYFKKTERISEKAFDNHKLVGQCGCLPFEMTFITTEYKGEDYRLYDVTQVNVHMECKGDPDLIRLVERTETTRNVQGFFRTLSKYAEWCDFRTKTFAHFKEQNPSAVRLPYGSSANNMSLVNPELPKCEMTLVWEVTIDDRGAVVPMLDLLTKFPEEAIALDKSAALEDAGAAFKNLLQLFGIHGSIEKIIQSFCLKKANVDP